MTPESNKVTKIPKFYRFYAILVNFSIDIVDWNVEKRSTRHKVAVQYSSMKKQMQFIECKNDSKNDKNSKSSQFVTCLCNFCKVFERLRGLER